MIKEKKLKILILDTSAFLSGKPIDFENQKLVTTYSISDELKPGGRDYQNFQYMLEKGLDTKSPSNVAIEKIKKTANESGDAGRLSNADIEVLALAYEISLKKEEEPVILTDDYSIQNVANILNINFVSIDQSGITERFKWACRCRGCGKKFKENISVCPICGSDTKTVIINKKHLRK
jgi:UPF0271 protein